MSYWLFKLDIDCFYDKMEKDYHLHFEFKPSVGMADDTQEQRVELTKRLFHRHIQEGFHDWVMYKVLDQRNGEHDYELFVDVWEFLYDITIVYSRVPYHRVILISMDEEEENNNE